MNLAGHRDRRLSRKKKIISSPEAILLNTIWTKNNQMQMKHSALVSLDGSRLDVVYVFPQFFSRHLIKSVEITYWAKNGSLDFANLRLFIKLTFIYSVNSSRKTISWVVYLRRHPESSRRRISFPCSSLIPGEWF